jgi:hypothetical protein
MGMVFPTINSSRRRIIAAVFIVIHSASFKVFTPNYSSCHEQLKYLCGDYNDLITK